MGLFEQLAFLESANLVRMAQVRPELEYFFRYAMVQDAAYLSLLKHNRRALHYLIGETLERLHAGRTDDIAAVLAHHFAEADDTQRAVKYYVRAGEPAARQYANAESLLHFGKALEIVRRAAVKNTPSLAQEPDLICRLLAGRGLFSEAAALRAGASEHLSFIAAQIADATLREYFLRQNRVTGNLEGA